MKLIEALKNLSSKINAEFDDSKLFNHSGEKGEFREQIISDFLRPFLPECYGLGTGQIFDKHDNSSNQIDIVIYDKIYSNVLFKDKNNSLFPCESVYGEIEIKSNLTTNELEKSFDNIKSLKELNREDSTMLDFSPIQNLKLGGGLKASENKLNNYIGVVFGYDGLTKETFIKKLGENLGRIERKYAPDFFFNLKQEYIVIKGKEGDLVGFSDDFDYYGVIEVEENVLPIMFLLLNVYLNQIRLKAPNYGEYLANILNPLLTEDSNMVVRPGKMQYYKNANY